jgi:hypothetical protein
MFEPKEYLLAIGINFNFQRDVQRDADHFFDDVRQSVNLKLISALTASRIYEEQLHRRMEILSKLAGEKIDLKASFSSAFDSSLENRVMYALRNHALHSQLPLSAITFGSSRLSITGDPRDEAPSRSRMTVDPKISTKEFCGSPKIRPATRAEVEQLGYEKLDLKFFARGFLSCLASCHDDFRRVTEGPLERALLDLKNAHLELKEAKGDEPKHVSIYKRYEGSVIEKHYIDYAKKLRILDLRRFWSGLKWIQRSYLSSKVVSYKDTYPENHGTIWIEK